MVISVITGVTRSSMKIAMEQSLISIVGKFRGRLDESWIEDHVALVKHGECKIALENLCDQIWEYDFSRSRGQVLSFALGETLYFKRAQRKT